MSIHNSYFSRNNTILSKSYTNTGRNPVTEIFYGAYPYNPNSPAYSRFIFDLDLTLLEEKITTGFISTGCSNNLVHTLRMTNTSAFEEELKNTQTSNGRMRATSFDLILFRIPYSNEESMTPQYWDEGVGYDFVDLVYEYKSDDKNFSVRPSNWYQTTTIDLWTEPGIYDNKNTGNFNYSALTIVDIQHFEFGDENISFDMSGEINSILDGSLVNTTGWGIAFKPQVENLSGLTDSYEVQFFTRHTQTFYEPYLETTYNDLIEDDRNSFTLGKINKLYLYLYEDGNPINLDNNPIVSIQDSNGDVIPSLSALTSCRRTAGVYEVTVPALLGYKTPCTFSDLWSNLYINGLQISNITNDFALYPFKKSFQIGTETIDPKVYGFDFYGLKQDEKIFNTDIRKVGVIIKQAYTTQKLLPNVNSYYRVYVREGQIEVQVQDWTKLSRSTNEYFFYFDTRDKIPNEYYVDLKVDSTGQITTYKRTIKFQIVSYK